MPKKNNNVLENIGPHKKENFILEEEKIEKNDKNLVSKSLNHKNYIKNGL